MAYIERVIERIDKYWVTIYMEALVLNNVNLIQSAIMQLGGGAFQILFDVYLYKTILPAL